jgi:hypothetical protein
MTASVKELLNSFDKLPEAEKRELASEIIKRSLTLDLPELSDESLVVAADKIFLQLDKEESIHVDAAKKGAVGDAHTVSGRNG